MTVWIMGVTGCDEGPKTEWLETVKAAAWEMGRALFSIADKLKEEGS